MLAAAPSRQIPLTTTSTTGPSAAGPVDAAPTNPTACIQLLPPLSTRSDAARTLPSRGGINHRDVPTRRRISVVLGDRDVTMTRRTRRLRRSAQRMVRGSALAKSFWMTARDSRGVVMTRISSGPRRNAERRVKRVARRKTAAGGGRAWEVDTARVMPRRLQLRWDATRVCSDGSATGTLMSFRLVSHPVLMGRLLLNVGRRRRLLELMLRLQEADLSALLWQMESSGLLSSFQPELPIMR